MGVLFVFSPPLMGVYSTAPVPSLIQRMQFLLN